ncbi:MAG TPA: ComF family protein [Clostridiaceae bacterium]|nr:ComF family protein [Clostridiaceae bacterium]
MLNFLRAENCLICNLSAGNNFFRQSELLRLGVLENRNTNPHLSFLMRHTCKDCLSKLPLLFPENTWSFEQSNLEIRALFAYKEPINQLLLSYKFYHNLYLANWFAEIMFLLWQKFWFDYKEQAVIVPIPLGKKRLRQRGFNQAAKIAELIAGFSEITFLPDFLIRQRETARQTEMRNRTARKTNLKDAFMINPELDCFACKIKQENLTVILFDDVTTTGITLSEAAKPLLAKGLKVSATVVATEHQVKTRQQLESSTYGGDFV